VTAAGRAVWERFGNAGGRISNGISKAHRCERLQDIKNLGQVTVHQQTFCQALLNLLHNAREDMDVVIPQCFQAAPSQFGEFGVALNGINLLHDATQYGFGKFVQFTLLLPGGIETRARESRTFSV
jgi:hypothetical protein